MMPSITNGNYSRMLKEASTAIKGEMMKLTNPVIIAKDESLQVVMKSIEPKLKAIHVALKQIASNTENLTTADIAKVAAANLQEVIESIRAQDSEQN
jgi:hypothetical protein